MGEFWEDPTDRQEAAEAQIKELEARLCSVVGELGHTKDGIAFLVWLIKQCGVLKQDYPADLTATAWNAGRRALGLQVLGLCIREGISGQILQEIERTETY